MGAIYVPLTDEELAKLRDLALRDRRDPRDEAAWLIVEGIQRRDDSPLVINDAIRRAAGRDPKL